MKNTVKAGLLALTAGSLPFASAAYAEDAPQAAPVAATMSATAPITLVSNADDAATEWNELHPNAIAFGVYLGTESKITPEQIKLALTALAKDEGVDTVEFFFEQNDVPGHSFAIYYRDAFKGALDTESVIAATRAAGRFLRTDREIFQTASNDYDTLN